VSQAAKLLEVVKVFDPISFHKASLRAPFGPIELELVLGCSSSGTRAATVHVLPYSRTGIAVGSGWWQLCAPPGEAPLTSGLSLKLRPDHELTPTALDGQIKPLGEFTGLPLAAALMSQFKELRSEGHARKMHVHRRVVRCTEFSDAIGLLLRLADKAGIDSSVALHGLAMLRQTVGEPMLTSFRTHIPDWEDEKNRQLYGEQHADFERMLDACRLVAVPA
jgi:hypothetical protein